MEVRDECVCVCVHRGEMAGQVCVQALVEHVAAFFGRAHGQSWLRLTHGVERAHLAHHPATLGATDRGGKQGDKGRRNGGKKWGEHRIPPHHGRKIKVLDQATHPAIRGTPHTEERREEDLPSEEKVGGGECVLGHGRNVHVVGQRSDGQTGRKVHQPRAEEEGRRR